MRSRPALTGLTAATLLLAACSAPDEELDTNRQDEQASPDEPDEPDEPDAVNGQITTTPDPDLVDLTAAVPGTWPVGDAGTVRFSIVGGALVLDDVTANDGWSFDIDEQHADEIEVDFTRGNVAWEIEIELEDDGRILEVEIDQDIESADPGSYDLADAGTFALRIVDGRLVLDDLNLADDWTLVERNEEADEIELEVVNGPRSFDVEVKLDDGTIELEINYEVAGPVTG